MIERRQKKGMRCALNPNTIQQAGFEEQIAACAAAEFEAIELMNDALDAYVGAGHSLAHVKGILTSTHVEVAAIYGGNPFGPGGHSRKLQRENVKAMDRYLGYCESLDCRILTVNSMDDVPIDVAAAWLRPTCERAAKAGVSVAYEPLGFAPQFSTLSTFRKLMDEVNMSNFGVLLDPFHLYRGGSTLDDIDLFPPERVLLAHFDDVKNVPLSEMTDLDRVFPGDGILDLTTFIQKLQGRSFNGFVSIEIFNKEYWREDPVAVLKEARKRMQRYLP